jgi:hypothetical protein
MASRKETDMSENSEPKAPQATRPLNDFEILIGQWEMLGNHHLLPSPFQGESSFEWLREGALLVWRFNWEHGKGIPNAFNIIGHDDALEPCSVFYTDERGVARIYQMTLAGGVWRMWRDSPDFSQRMTGSFSDDGNTINWHGELSRDGSSWEPDLMIKYTRKV